MAIHYGMCGLSGGKSLKKDEFSHRNHQLPITHQRGWDFMSSSGIHAKILAGLFYCVSCACTHSCCGFMCTWQGKYCFTATVATRKDFLNVTPVGKALKNTVDKWYLMKLKYLFAIKDTITWGKRKPTYWVCFSTVLPLAESQCLEHINKSRI